MCEDENVIVLAPEASSLSTLGYWQSHYQKELEIFQQTGDCGEIWFGEDREDCIISWCCQALGPEKWINSKLLDIGCGNGHFLLKVYQHRSSLSSSFPTSTNHENPRLFGLDYSQSSLELAQNCISQALADDDQSSSMEAFEFKQADLLNLPSLEARNLFESAVPMDVLVDKGTWDAISLTCHVASEDAFNECKSEDSSANSRLEFIQKHLVPKYLDAIIGGFIHVDSLYILATCNWTLSEVEAMFSASRPDLKLIHTIPPSSRKRQSFAFGGVTGNSVSIGVFKLQ